MNFSVSKIRFFFEVVSLPFFVFLVVHLAGHGVELFFHAENHGHENGDFFTRETLFGVFLAAIFVAAWNFSFLKKLVPCRHDHCHAEKSPAHFLAIAAFCAHFFPEAGVRHELLANFSAENTISVATVIAFFSHFLVDVIVAVALVSYFSDRRAAILTFLGIVFVWLLAFFSVGFFQNLFSDFAAGFGFLISAFLLAMFVHWPHFPKKCQKCDH